ncbi:MAG: ferritin-like domain-containing protein [Actinomycetota bacterium]|nr:ferritin-like domain-containing protein [Actinomycetota bacterium]
MTDHPHLPSRRDLLRIVGLGAGAAGGLVFAGCGGGDESALGAPDPRATPQRDRAILNGALNLENTTVAAYTAGLPLLRGDVRRHAGRFLEAEREHAAALTLLVRRMGGEPNRRKPPEDYRAAFPRLRGQADFLRFLTDLENVAISAYVEGLPKLLDGRLRQTMASILADEAQHVTVLLGARSPGRPDVAVPEPFVTGRAAA